MTEILNKTNAQLRQLWKCSEDNYSAFQMKSRIFVALNIPDEAKDKLFEIINQLTIDKNLKWEKKGQNSSHT